MPPMCGQFGGGGQHLLDSGRFYGWKSNSRARRRHLLNFRRTNHIARPMRVHKLRILPTEPHCAPNTITISIYVIMRTEHRTISDGGARYNGNRYAHKHVPQSAYIIVWRRPRLCGSSGPGTPLATGGRRTVKCQFRIHIWEARFFVV